MASNGDTKLKIIIGGQKVVGIGSFHKSLPHNEYGEVIPKSFAEFVKQTRSKTPQFDNIDAGQAEPGTTTAKLVNPQAGLAKDRLTSDPTTFKMSPAPLVLGTSTAAEMTELYWMAVLRDKSFDTFATDPAVLDAAKELNDKFALATKDKKDPGRLVAGVDLPGGAGKLAPITGKNVFRMGLPGEEFGPLVSQFFVRDAGFGTQTIDQKQRPYTAGANYLNNYQDWLVAQRSGNGADGLPYQHANESKESYYEPNKRYIATMRDLARFVNKDALHQAYFNAALLLLSGEAKWTPGNPYVDGGALAQRETGFGTLGGPHILALVSEVATRALKVVWYQKWQVNLRLRPEAYGGHLHVQEVGAPAGKRAYGLPAWAATTIGATKARALNAAAEGGEDGLFLPMAFTPGSPVHPAYGAGHATVAGACVTVLKAYFQTFEGTGDKAKPLSITTLKERSNPYDPLSVFKTYVTRAEPNGKGCVLETDEDGMTIEGELNKLAMNVAMGRSMGGVHWRSDNTRSFQLGEALAAHILADITTDVAEPVAFTFRTFSRKANGKPKVVTIGQGKVFVDGVKVPKNASKL